MAATLPSNPSGITLLDIQNWALADAAMSIGSSGAGAIASGTLDYLTEKSIISLNSYLGTSYYISSGAVTPTPDYDTIYLLTMQLECKLAQYNINAAKSTPDIKSVRVDDIAIEFGDVSDFKLKSAESKYGPCKEFDELVDKYLLEDGLGEASIIWWGAVRRYQSVDFDGTGNATVYNNQGDNSTYTDDGWSGTFGDPDNPRIL